MQRGVFRATDSPALRRRTDRVLRLARESHHHGAREGRGKYAEERRCDALSGRRNSRIDLGLALLSIARRPGEALTLEDIAAWCGCRPSTIFRIQTAAMKKAWWHPQNPAVLGAILAAMKKPPAVARTSATPFKYHQQYGLIVVCEDEADQKRKFEQLKKRGLSVRVVTV